YVIVSRNSLTMIRRDSLNTTYDCRNAIKTVCSMVPGMRTAKSLRHKPNHPLQQMGEAAVASDSVVRCYRLVRFDRLRSRGPFLSAWLVRPWPSAWSRTLDAAQCVRHSNE